MVVIGSRGAEDQLKICLSVNYIPQQSSDTLLPLSQVCFFTLKRSRGQTVWSGEPKARNRLASVSQSNTSTPTMIVQLKAPPTLPTQPFITNFSNKTHPTLICSVLCRGERQQEGSVQQRGCSSSAAMNSSSVEANVRS